MPLLRLPELVYNIQMAYSSKRRGWGDEHLELLREQPNENLTSHVAVNLQQFRNEQIGVGYQAKHVIRQRIVPGESTVVQNVTQGSTTTTHVQSKRKKETNGTDCTEKPKTTGKLQKYMKCEKLRQFRKELASIESSH